MKFRLQPLEILLTCTVYSYLCETRSKALAKGGLLHLHSHCLGQSFQGLVLVVGSKILHKTILLHNTDLGGITPPKPDPGQKYVKYQKSDYFCRSSILSFESSLKKVS